MKNLMLSLALILRGAQLAAAQAPAFQNVACSAQEDGSSDAMVFSGCNVQPGDTIVLCMALPSVPAGDAGGGTWGVICNASSWHPGPAGD